MTYMSIYWKRKPDALRKLLEKYAGNKDVKHVGHDGWEILVNSEEIIREIRKYCQYRNKNVIIDKIEEIEEDEEEEIDEIDEFEEGIYETVELYDRFEEEVNELVTEIELEHAKNEFSKWQDFYGENLPDEEVIMGLYQQPEFRCTCYDECDCEENYMSRKMIETFILQGRYHSSCISNKRLEMQKMLDRYY